MDGAFRHSQGQSQQPKQLMNLMTSLPKESKNHEVHDHTLGDILRRAKGLTHDQVQQALRYQQEHNIRFGEAVVALGLATPADVIWALAQQFHYPYSPGAEHGVNKELVVANDPFAESVESFRNIRSQLIMSVLGPSEKRSALALVSPHVGEGKTFVAANLAVAFSQLPGRTLVVDADLRTPRLHEVFGSELTGGLSSILAGRSEPNVIKPVEHLPNLYFLPAGVGAPNPVELLHSSAFSLLLRELLGKFDYVLVDTPAAVYGSDARIIASHCGSALVIGRKDKTKVADIQHLVKQLKNGSVQIAGALMNEF